MPDGKTLGRKRTSALDGYPVVFTTSAGIFRSPDRSVLSMVRFKEFIMGGKRRVRQSGTSGRKGVGVILRRWFQCASFLQFAV